MLILDKLLAELLAQSQPSLLVLSGSLALCACFNFRISAFRFKSAVRGRFLITGSRFARFLLKSLLLKRNLCKAGDGRQSAQRLAHIAREAGARWAKGAKRILPIGLQLQEVGDFYHKCRCGKPMFD